MRGTESGTAKAGRSTNPKSKARMAETLRFAARHSVHVAHG
jgi:hypothetical protein